MRTQATTSRLQSSGVFEGCPRPRNTGVRNYGLAWNSEGSRCLQQGWRLWPLSAIGPQCKYFRHPAVVRFSLRHMACKILVRWSTKSRDRSSRQPCPVCQDPRSMGGPRPACRTPRPTIQDSAGPLASARCLLAKGAPGGSGLLGGHFLPATSLAPDTHPAAYGLHQAF